MLELKNIEIEYFVEWKNKNSTWMKLNEWEKLTLWDRDVIQKKTEQELLDMIGSFYIKGKKEEALASDVLNEANGQLIGYMKTNQILSPREEGLWIFPPSNWSFKNYFQTIF